MGARLPSSGTRAAARAGRRALRSSVRLTVRLAEEFADRRVAVRRQAVNAVAGLDRARFGLCVRVGAELWRRSGVALRRVHASIALPLTMRALPLTVRARTLTVRARAFPQRLSARPVAVSLILLRGRRRLHPGSGEDRANFLGRELERMPTLYPRRHRDGSIARANEPAHRQAQRPNSRRTSRLRPSLITM
jgi:hypothetical protein